MTEPHRVHPCWFQYGEQTYIIARVLRLVTKSSRLPRETDIQAESNTMPFSGMPIGTIIHNIEMK
jgi:large subunit ribosomal protein L2